MNLLKAVAVYAYCLTAIVVLSASIVIMFFGPVGWLSMLFGAR